MRVVVIAAVLVACGGSPKSKAPERPEDPALKAAEAERAKLDAEKPASPYEPRAVHGFKSPAVCGQGPYRIPAQALGAKYGERIQVVICAKGSVDADYKFTTGKEVAVEPRHFGWAGDNKRCTATATELATSGGGAGGGTASAGKPGAKTAGKPATTAVAKTIELDAVVVASDKCPDGMFSTSIHDYSIETTTGIAVPAGTTFTTEIWSAVPMHLEDAIFLVRQTAPRADLTVEQWRDYQDRYSAWSKKYRDFVDGEVNAGRSHYVDSTARTKESPPPPRAETQPPRPSTHATWIPGYWHRETEWSWIEGFWRVPEEDIAADQTAHAPVAPPPERVEAPAPLRPAAVAVWTPGYWSWDGRGYIWIAGAWRIPPASGNVWITPTWRPRGGRAVVFVPGGWSLRRR